MKLDDMIMVSIDDHLVEPPDVFEHHLPARWRDVAPYNVRKENGTDVWIFDGREIPNIAINAVAGRPAEEYGLEPTSYEQLRPGTFDIHERIRDMNANGVLGSLCFPSFPGFTGRLFGTIDDKTAALALVQAYNDWHIDEWCGTYPGRMIPCAIVPLWDPELAAAEIRRTSEKGSKAVTFPEDPTPLGYPSLHDQAWDPFWGACSDTSTNVCMHIGSSSKLIVTTPDAPVDVSIVLQGLNIVNVATDLTFSQVFNRFPELQVSLTEGGIGWIPYFLERADDTYRVHHKWTGADFGGRMPSDVVRDHFVFCFIKDPHGLAMAREIGLDRICWETDYPHSDSTWPTGPERLLRDVEGTGLTDAEINQLTYENAMRHYHYDPFQHIPKEQATVGALRAQALDVDLSPRSTGLLVDRAPGAKTIADMTAIASA